MHSLVPLYMQMDHDSPTRKRAVQQEIDLINGLRVAEAKRGPKSKTEKIPSLNPGKPLTGMTRLSVAAGGLGHSASLTRQ